jgi:hypothetical protein
MPHLTRRHRPELALTLGLIIFLGVLGLLWWTDADLTTGIIAAIAVITVFEIIDRTIA